MKRREFIQWTAAGSMAFMGLSGCGTNKSSADVGLPKKTPEPVSQPPVASVAAPPMVVVNGTDPDELMERGLQAMGGIGRFVKQGQTVVIKPNFSVPRTPDQAATTNPVMVAALVKRCLGAGASSVKASNQLASKLHFEITRVLSGFNIALHLFDIRQGFLE